MNPEALVAQHISDGRLIDLDPSDPLDISLYWQFSRLTGRATAPLTQALMAAARTRLIRGQIDEPDRNAVPQ